jgi:hypothetical protein
MFLICKLENGQYQYWNKPSEWWVIREEAATRFTQEERNNKLLPLNSFWLRARK